MRTREPWCWCWRCRARQRRRITATLMALILAAGFLAHEHSTSSHTSPPPPARTTPAPRPKTTARRAPVPSPATLEADAAQGLTWASFHGMPLPASAAGPRNTLDGLASGFADTPQGALLAAINIGVRTAAQWGSAIFVPTITRQVTGPATPALLHAEETTYAQLRAAAHVRPGRPTGKGNASEIGYRFLSWSPAVATLAVVTDGPTASGATVLASTRIQVVWQAGDWRAVAPPGGNWANAANAISSPLGYTIFPGR
jgi:hypothetical protein